ncbi:hypothetical protein B5S32_g3423 [[Candida] boidinii]|nr:hypothetical protein B5S32_g3423 [[Candida] boidinii]
MAGKLLGDGDGIVPAERKRKHESESNVQPSAYEKDGDSDYDDGDEFDDEDDSKIKESNKKRKHLNSALSESGLYLDTINRKVLDFDSEKVCSVSLSDSNVYCCLVCGKYLKGRDRTSPAFNHSMNENHHVFISFSDRNFYILPENYKIDEKNSNYLKDIKDNLNPHYTQEDVKALYSLSEFSIDLNNSQYRPGFIGINNINNTNDYSNVTLQVLSHCNRLRDYLLVDQKQLGKIDLFKKLSIVFKKIWFKNLFKSHISTYDFLKTVGLSSKNKFNLHKQNDPKEFLIWILNKLNSEFMSELKLNKSPISVEFQGKLVNRTNLKINKFWLVSLDLPSINVFKDENIVQQVTLTKILSDKLKDYKIIKFPNILIIHIDRFKYNNRDGERSNNTIVKFPLTMELNEFNNLENENILIENESKITNIEKLNSQSHKYRLIANIVHESTNSSEVDIEVTNKRRSDASRGSGINKVSALDSASSVSMGDGNGSDHYKVQLLDKVRNEWMLIDDLKYSVIEKELLFLDPSYIQIWEKY